MMFFTFNSEKDWLLNGDSAYLKESDHLQSFFSMCIFKRLAIKWGFCLFEGIEPFAIFFLKDWPLNGDSVYLKESNHLQSFLLCVYFQKIGH